MRVVSRTVVSASKNGTSSASVVLPFAASSARRARRELDSWMGERGCPDEVIQDARLVVSELVGNSVRHARPLSDGTLKVSWKTGGSGFEIAVTDGGGGTHPHRVNAGASAIAGRGLAIIETLAARWWTDGNGTRSTVHALLRA